MPSDTPGPLEPSTPFGVSLLVAFKFSMESMPRVSIHFIHLKLGTAKILQIPKRLTRARRILKEPGCSITISLPHALQTKRNTKVLNGTVMILLIPSQLPTLNPFHTDQFTVSPRMVDQSTLQC